jgi:uncharacterized protein (DUF305 family)
MDIATSADVNCRVSTPQNDTNSDVYQMQDTYTYDDGGDSPSNRHAMVDHEVYAWVMEQTANNKTVSSNEIRQKAYDIGKQYDQYFKASNNWYNKWRKKFKYDGKPEIDNLRHRKRIYTAGFKLHAVNRSAELLSVSQASLELNVSRRCLQRWKEELDVITSVAEQASNAVFRRPGQGRKVADSALDQQLVEWVEQSWKDGQQVTSSMIREKAKELSTNPDFKASLGWFIKWQKRHNINLKDHVIDSPSRKSTNKTPLKLRILPDGQHSAYSENIPFSRKRKRTQSDMDQLEGDEEFDRMLLTWLVEHWDSANIVTEKMLRDKAYQLKPGFHPTKVWLTDWMRQYNVSLESQTFGGIEDSNDEVVEESQVYDEITVHDNDGPVTPTKEEAATALASLATEDPGGLEIAEALQKLASAFGLSQNVNNDEVVPEHLEIPTSSNLISPTTTYIIDEGVVELGAEDVVSEEIVTDDPVVYDATNPTTDKDQVHFVLTNDVSQLPLSDYQSVDDVPILTTYTSHAPIVSAVAYQTEVMTCNQLSITTDIQKDKQQIEDVETQTYVSIPETGSVTVGSEDVVIEESLMDPHTALDHDMVTKHWDDVDELITHSTNSNSLQQ